MQRHSRQFWEEQLREYWDSGFTVSEYSELIGQPHMTVMRWIRKFHSEHKSSEIIESEQAESDRHADCPVRMIEIVPKQIEEDAEARSHVIAEFKADSKKVEAFRRIFETRGRLGEQETAILLLSRYEVHGQIASGVMKHIMAHTPSMMRLIYHLPELGT
jgi:hypothetical protein